MLAIQILQINFSQQVKQKSGTIYNEVESGDRTSTPGCSDIANSPQWMPISAKGGRAYGQPKVSKSTRSLLQIPASKAGEIICPYFLMSVSKNWLLLLPMPGHKLKRNHLKRIVFMVQFFFSFYVPHPHHFGPSKCFLPTKTNEHKQICNSTI